MDTNTIRVISRIFNLNSEKARKLNDKKLYKKINNFVIKGNSKEINYALLDFAAIICKSKNPLCDKCVIRDYCRQYNDKQAKKINYKKSRRV